MKTRLSARGQVVIPKALRDALGWTEGQLLEVDLTGDRVVLGRPATRSVGEPSWMRWEGVLAGTDALEDLAAEHRAEIEQDARRLRELG